MKKVIFIDTENKEIIHEDKHPKFIPKYGDFIKVKDISELFLVSSTVFNYEYEEIVCGVKKYAI